MARAAIAGLLLALFGGCAALTNPVAEGVPVEAVPHELLGASREGEQLVPMNLFAQAQPPVYRLDAGDVLGIYIETLLDDKTIVPIVRVPERSRLAPERRDLPSGLGYPIEVRRDGTLTLPRIKPIVVKGLSVEEAEAAVRKAYVDAGVLTDKSRIFVTLLHRRLVHVLVFRRDLLANRVFENIATTRVGLFGGGAELFGTGLTGAGFEINLPAYENDLLHALALTGGFPGTNAAPKITIFRNPRRPVAALGQPLPDKEMLPPPTPLDNPLLVRVSEIQLRLRPGDPFTFGPEEVILHDGDTVLVEAAPVDTFYTGGLLPSAEHILPRDYDLDVVEAVSRVRGPMVNGAFGGSNLSGVLIDRGIGNPSPRLLSVVRRTPEGGQIPIIVDLHKALVDARERILVQPGDVLILQETKRQALVRYFTDTFNFFSVFRPYNRRDALGEFFFTVP